MPPLAASNRPGRSCVAPVKAPFACPNSSLSSRLSVTAAQFTATNALCARLDSSWISRAIRSLPTPLSPVISTVESTFAARRASPSTRFISSRARHHPRGVLRVPRHPRQRPPLHPQLLLGLLQRLRHLPQRALHALRLVEAQRLHALRPPLLARLAEDLAHRVSLAHAPRLQAVDGLAVAVAHVPAGEPRQAPAHRLIRPPQVQQVLLRLVGLAPQRLGERARARPPACAPPARRAPVPAGCAAGRPPASTPTRPARGTPSSSPRPSATRARSPAASECLAPPSSPPCRSAPCAAAPAPPRPSAAPAAPRSGSAPPSGSKVSNSRQVQLQPVSPWRSGSFQNDAI